LITRLRRVGLLGVTRFTVRLGALALRRPTEAADHVMTQIAFMRGRHVAAPLPRTLNWRPVLHQRIGAAWPCNPGGDFPQLWEAISASAPIVSSEAVDHDADRTLAEMVWCLVRHLRPRVVVETGVARGMTARVILEAFRRNADGHLWSVDLPPLDEPWRSLVGTAVPPTMRDRWTYVRGASRRRLPDLCRRIPPIDVFIHDSLHTPENLHFELATVWPYLRAGAAIVIDDADDCAALDVVQEFGELPVLGAAEERKGTSAAYVAKPSAPPRQALLESVT
jgi:hypothetical protein